VTSADGRQWLGIVENVSYCLIGQMILFAAWPNSGYRNIKFIDQVRIADSFFVNIA
jgi:hypothetical protein